MALCKAAVVKNCIKYRLLTARNFVSLTRGPIFALSNLSTRGFVACVRRKDLCHHFYHSLDARQTHLVAISDLEIAIVAKYHTVVIERNKTEVDRNDTQIERNYAEVGTNDTEAGINDTELDRNDTQIEKNDAEVGTNGTEVERNDIHTERNDTEIEINVTEPERNETDLFLQESQTPDMPWYLRGDLPQRSVDQVFDQQQIPELPESPPPILHPLLNHLSIKLGLDCLTLLDLRKLEPSPSLGANLIMLIATARSEKHLHISADRLCRWLRSEYKLKPDADGLLGRNELKIRLKRKANKLKLMGPSFQVISDDGIRTGWVCVDAGIVESSQATEKTISPGNFIGFGQRIEGTRIIIQLLTSEKRKEVALEKLWNGVLQKGGQLESPEDFDENGFLIEDDRPYDK